MSIILTTRDRQVLVKRALESALSQTVRDIEVVVVDDGSNPPFELEPTHPQVSVVRLPEPRGVSAARNVGLARARGEWVTFLDDDDELLPEMLEISLGALERSSLPAPVAVVSAIETLRPDGSTQEIRLPQPVPRGRDYFLEAGTGARASIGNTLVIGRELLTGLGGFDEDLRAAVHSELFLRINPVCSIEGVPVVTYVLGRHEGSHVHMNELDRARAMELTIRKHRAAFRRHPAGHARFLSSIGISHMKSGRWGDAIRFSTGAVRTYPWDVKVVRSWLATLGGPPLLAAYRLIRTLRRDRVASRVGPRRIGRWPRASGRAARPPRPGPAEHATGDPHEATDERQEVPGPR